MRFFFVLAGVLAGFFLLGAFALRIPTVQDALFDRALQENFSPRAAPLFDGDGLKVFFCGTGSPLPSRKRAQACTLIIAGEKVFLVDAGTGSWENVQAAGIGGERLAGVFLTHFHSDHIGDLGEADFGSWISGRQAPLVVHGPDGVERVVAGFNEAYELDRQYRTAHHGKGIAPPRAAGLVAQPFASDTPIVVPIVVYDKDRLKVTAFRVNHDPVKPAAGYRFDYEGRSVVVSGDTTVSQSLVDAAKGADLLVHEAQSNAMVAKIEAAARRAGNTRLAAIFSDIPSYHTSPEEAAEIANAAGVDLLALTHLTPAPDNAVAKRIFMRGVSKIRPRGVMMAEDGAVIILPRAGGIEIR